MADKAMGFDIYSWKPFCKNISLVPLMALAVSAMTGSLLIPGSLWLRINAVVSIPSISGIIWSMSTIW